MLKLVFLAASMFLSTDGPKRNDWVCFVASVGDKGCSVYGYSKSKKVALQSAFSLCENHCESKCELDYCEKVR